MNHERSQVLDKRQVQMIKKLLKQGLNKTEVARRLGISREIVRKYAKLPDGYVPTINKAAIANIVDPYLPAHSTNKCNFHLTKQPLLLKL